MSYSIDGGWLRELLVHDDLLMLIDYTEGMYLKPNLVIAPDDTGPYLFRWHIRRGPACVYCHLQVKSDPERPLHDHPWDNTSVILAGGYDEIWTPHPEDDALTQEKPIRFLRPLRKGDMVHRSAEEAHRLVLPDGTRYSMSLFMTGPKKRSWGFWYPDGWHHHEQHEATRDGVSVGHHEGDKV